MDQTTEAMANQETSSTHSSCANISPPSTPFSTPSPPSEQEEKSGEPVQMMEEESDSYSSALWERLFNENAMPESNMSAMTNPFVAGSEGFMPSNFAFVPTNYQQTMPSYYSTAPHASSDDVSSLSRLTTSDHLLGTIPSSSRYQQNSSAALMQSYSSTIKEEPYTYVPHRQKEPLFALSIGCLNDGSCMPLSKPILRDDGLLIVGTEMLQSSNNPTGTRNYILVTNYRSSLAFQPPVYIPIQHEVRDLDWMTNHSAVVAIGSDIYTLATGNDREGRTVQLHHGPGRVHCDVIREVAVWPTKPSCFVSGGFDETVVLTDLRGDSDPSAAAIIAKFDAQNVVSSLRWSHTRDVMSWTTDTGDLQFVDVRCRGAQICTSRGSFLHAEALGGLFTHTYLSQHMIALGFESGNIALVDIRMPDQASWYATMKSPLTAIGEACSDRNKQLFFGYDGFVMAEWKEASKQLEPLILHQAHEMSSNGQRYKTSGAFTKDSASVLAVSDNLGVVTLYDENASISSDAFPPTDLHWQDSLFNF